ncbi:hypothetical protein [Flavobacterium sp.]|uniref:hypothetical protein n=1 Tax=Flavobacterium sp. TaxID=239 RepID=UPI00286A3F47|nr:hypothetical protein [Flavobacterium sp.]
METKATTQVTRFLYVAFVLFGCYQIFVLQSYVNASASFGIALAFDPFNHLQPWKERPRWQKIWLIVHLAIVALLYGYAVGVNDKN